MKKPEEDSDESVVAPGVLTSERAGESEAEGERDA